MVSLSNHHDETLPPEGEGEGTGEAFWEPSIFFRLHHLWHSSLAKGKRSQAVNQHPPMEVVGEVFGVIEISEKVKKCLSRGRIVAFQSSLIKG
jgi:hypothetical protein